MTHALSCNIGVLVIACHKNICDELLYISRSAFASASVRTKHLIHQGHTRFKREIRQGSDKQKDARGVVMIRGLWYFQVDVIIDVKLGYADTDTYKYDTITSLLAR